MFKSLLALARITEKGKDCSLSSFTTMEAREFYGDKLHTINIYSISQCPVAGLAPNLSPWPFSCQQNKWMPLIRCSPVIRNALTFSLLSMVMAICILLPRRKATKWSVSSSLRSGTLPGPGKLSVRFSLTIRLPWKGQDELTTPPLALSSALPRRVAIPKLQRILVWLNTNMSQIVSLLGL